MTFKKLNTYVLPNAHSTTQVKVGEVVVSKGNNATALRFKVSAQLKNTGGARALTAAERGAFLDGFDYTLQWGAGRQHKPRSNVGFNRERVLIKQLMGSEMEGWSDAATGLARSIGATNTTVEWYQRIHLCGVWKDPDADALFGVGPTQAASIHLDLRRQAPPLPAGFTLEGAVTLDLIPDEFPSKYDRVTPIPRWHVFSEENKVGRFLPGLPWYCVERTIAHVASPLTDVSFRIDGLELYSKVSVNEVVSKWLDVPGYWAENQTFDVDTVLHLVLPGQRMRDWPTGTPVIEQDTKTLPTMQLAQLVTEVMTESQVEKDVAYFAAKKGRRLSAVMLPTLLEMPKVPYNLLFALPYALLDEADSEFDKYPGVSCAPKEEPRLYLPAAVVARAQARIQLHEAAQEFLAAEGVRRELAAAIPAAVQHPRGWGEGTSRYLEAVREAVAA